MPFGQFGVLDNRNVVEAEKLIEASDFIILAGGHVPTQNAFFRRIRLSVLLENYPGAIVYAQPELEGESIDPFFHRFLPGLKLTKLKILPHYQQVKDWTLDGKRLFEDITYPDSMGECFYALPDGSYLYQENGAETLYGEVWRISDGKIEKICEQGASLRL